MSIVKEEQDRNMKEKINLKSKTTRLKEIKKSSKGITLIALVITIIVLLILAGVSIAMLTGENGILTQATEAKKANTVGAEKEQIQLAMQSLKMKKQADNVSTIVTAEELQNQLIADGAKNVTVENGESDSLVVKYADSKNQYTVNQNGEIGANGQTPDTPGTGESGNLPSNENTKPFLPTGATVVEKDLNKGVVIEDSKGNYWTWIEVPKSIYANATYNGGEAPANSEDYAKIESTMQKYAEAYRKSDYTDEWQEEAQHGFTSATEYNNHKKAMLKSVYENGGFYIGKYEAGTNTVRISADAELTTPVIKEGAYPYNYVTNKQAQEKSKELATGGRTGSLMFGIQWDLVLKHIETKKGKTQEELKNDSKTWGNYSNATFEITKGKYSTDYGQTFIPVEGTYTKPADTNVLLTTGATERNSVLNIYDLAGNEYEWTLEKSTDTYLPSVYRGSYYNNHGSSIPASYRINGPAFSSSDLISFRPALW